MHADMHATVAGRRLLSIPVIKADEQGAIERLIATQGTRIKEAFKIFLKATKSRRTLQEVRIALERGRIEEALEIVDAHVARFGNVFTRVFTDVGEREAQTLARRAGLTNARIAIDFDPTNPRAAALMRRNRLNLVTQFTRTQREATRQALIQAMRTGQGPVAAARAFRDSIGLTYHQQNAVNRYRDLLEVGSREALQRDLRDRRFDSTVARAAEAGEPLAATQISTMVERYRERYLQYRAETIARTESLHVVNQARHEAFEQVVEQANLDPGLVVRTWMATRDNRVRDSHAAMDGQTRGLNEPFQSPTGARMMFPGDSSLGAQPGDFVNCRCVVTTTILQESVPVPV